jgi:hypothetical protein
MSPFVLAVEHKVRRILSRIGVKTAVMIPLTHSARPLIAPCVSPSSSARAVPSPWAAAPMARPKAVGLTTPSQRRTVGPMTAPKTPVITTMAAVKEGMPLSFSTIPMAIGVVADLGAMEIMMRSPAPSRPARPAALSMPTMLPVSMEMLIAAPRFLMVSMCSYRGTPRATTAGPSQKLMY